MDTTQEPQTIFRWLEQKPNSDFSYAEPFVKGLKPGLSRNVHNLSSCLVGSSMYFTTLSLRFCVEYLPRTQPRFKRGIRPHLYSHELLQTFPLVRCWCCIQRLFCQKLYFQMRFVFLSAETRQNAKQMILDKNKEHWNSFNESEKQVCEWKLFRTHLVGFH